MDLVDKMLQRSNQFSNSANSTNSTNSGSTTAMLAETKTPITSVSTNSDYLEREGTNNMNVLKAKIEQNRRKKFQKQRAVIKKEEEMDLITSFDQIDGIDEGKPWKKLDAWLRKKKLMEYLEEHNLNDDERGVLMEKLKKGGLNSTKKVNYDSVLGKIIAIH